MYYERKWKGDDSPEGREAMAQIERIKRNRNWGQPYVRRCCAAFALSASYRSASELSILVSLVRPRTIRARPIHKRMVGRSCSPSVEKVS